MRTYAAIAIPAALVITVYVAFFSGPDAIPSSAKPYLPAITNALNHEEPLCIDARQLTLDKPVLPSAVLCKPCRHFEDLGLVQKQSGADNKFSYVLTDAGQKAYTLPSVADRFDTPKFCLGTRRLKEIIQVSAPANPLPGEKYIFVKYTMEVLNPQPALYSKYLTMDDYLPILPPGGTVSHPLMAGFVARPPANIEPVGLGYLFDRWITEVDKVKQRENEELQKRQTQVAR